MLIPFVCNCITRFQTGGQNGRRIAPRAHDVPAVDDAFLRFVYVSDHEGISARVGPTHRGRSDLRKLTHANVDTTGRDSTPQGATRARLVPVLGNGGLSRPDRLLRVPRSTTDQRVRRGLTPTVFSLKLREVYQGLIDTMHGLQ